MISHLVNHLKTLIDIDLQFISPVSKQLKSYFRNNKALGSSDRFILKKLYFCYIRNKIMIDEISNSNEEASKSAISLYFFDLDLAWSNRKINIYKKLENYFNSQNPDIYDKLIPNFIDTLKDNRKLTGKYSFPDNYFHELNRFKEFIDIEKLLSILHSFSPVSVISHSESFSSDNMYSANFTKTEIFQDHFYYNGNDNLKDSTPYKQGEIDLQDVGSRLICEMINPKCDSTILDACAGAGGKSLTLAKLTNNKSQIWAHDSDKRKLNNLKTRLKRHKYNSIKVINNIETSNLKFDYVLVDAPCTGSGTIRRFPEKKYTITESIISSSHNIQFDILSYYSKFVKDGGCLFYSTCSLFEYENESVAQRFLEKSKEFNPLNFNDYSDKTLLSKLYVTGNQINILPKFYDGDCFFIAGFQKGKVIE